MPPPHCAHATVSPPLHQHLWLHPLPRPCLCFHRLPRSTTTAPTSRSQAMPRHRTRLACTDGFSASCLLSHCTAFASPNPSPRRNLADPVWCPMILSFACRSPDHRISLGTMLSISISHLLLSSFVFSPLDEYNDYLYFLSIPSCRESVLLWLI